MGSSWCGKRQVRNSREKGEILHSSATRAVGLEATIQFIKNTEVVRWRLGKNDL